MSQIDAFVGTAHQGRARSTDPETSKATAASLDESKLTAVQARILRCFRVYGPMHDKALYDRLVDMEKQLGLPKPTSPSGARSRRSDLAKPNMERLAAIVREHTGVGVAPRDIASADTSAEVVAFAREQLRREGFRSPLWDSGRRVEVDGHKVIVWEVAE